MDVETLTLPFRFAFMQNAFLIAALAAVPTALLSCFLVIRGQALVGDAVAHAILPGVVLAHIIGVPLILGAFAAGMTCTVVTGYLANNSRVKQDTVLGVVFSGMFGLGLVLHVAAESGAHLDHILFGNTLGADRGALWTTGLIGAGVTLGIAAKWKDLLLCGFDPAQARACGLWAGVLHYGFLSALSLTVVATLSATGLILAIGLLITPGAIAFLLVRRFQTMLWVAAGVNVAAMLGGTYLAFHLDSAPAPTVVLMLTALFGAAFVRHRWQARRAAVAGRIRGPGQGSGGPVGRQGARAR
ncbi:MAG: metal ABC transporter permease [Rhodobacteraceae bacterium]|nr:metal ABC transporter permease [Paracoccaceae bacterium]